MIDYWDYWYGYDAPYGGQGMATTLPVEHERDLVSELRDVISEVTRKPCDGPTKPRIGFI
jgi:hypothetical protein